MRMLHRKFAWQWLASKVFWIMICAAQHMHKKMQPKTMLLFREHMNFQLHLPSSEPHVCFHTTLKNELSFVSNTEWHRNIIFQLRDCIFLYKCQQMFLPLIYSSAFLYLFFSGLRFICIGIVSKKSMKIQEQFMKAHL